MKLLEEVGIRFLIGLFIAGLIGFAFWWFVAHNESDRVVEKSFQKFYAAIEKTCDINAQRDNPVNVYIEIPQARTNVLERMIDEVEKIIRGAKLEIPFQAFQDPYYSFHWEKFPPEAPYTISADITRVHETLAAIFIPWREDLPWSSNLFLTMGINSLLFGADLFGEAMIKKSLLETKKTLSNYLIKIKKRLADDENFLKEMIEFMTEAKQKIIYAKENLEVVFERIGDKIKIIKKVGNVVVKESTFISKTTAYYTLFCLVLFDKTLGECLVEGSLVSTVGFIPARYFLRKVSSLFLKKINLFVWKIKSGVSDFAIKVKDYFVDYIEFLRVKISTLGDYFSFEELKTIREIQDEIKELLSSLDRIIKVEKNSEASIRIIDEVVQKIEDLHTIIYKKLDEEDIGESVVQMLRTLKADLEVEMEKLFELKNKIIEEGLSERPYATISLEYIEDAFDEIIAQRKEYVKKYLKDIGFSPKTVEIDEKIDVFLVLDDEKNKHFREIAEALKVCEVEKCANLNRYGDFRFIYDKERKTLKAILYDPIESSIDKYMRMPAYALKKLGENLIFKEMISNEVMSEVLEDMKEILIKNNNERLFELVESLKKIGIKTTPEEVLDMIEKTIYRLENEDIIGVLVAKDTKIYDLLQKYPRIRNNPKELSHAIREYFYRYILEEKDKYEIKHFYDFIRGKSFKLTEDIGVFFRTNPLGYASLRAIDLYTPLGASYWDEYFSMYGYVGQKIPDGCQTSCDEGKICLQLGACFRQFELPESCKRKGVSSIKLERNSLIAPNPRFYLVSPCYGTARIYLKDENGVRNVYVSVSIDNKRGTSYCFATANFVNFYISTYLTQYATQFACKAIISFISGGLASPLAFKLCPFFVELFFDFIRESSLVWPTVYQHHPYLS